MLDLKRMCVFTIPACAAQQEDVFPTQHTHVEKKTFYNPQKQGLSRHTCVRSARWHTPNNVEASSNSVLQEKTCDWNLSFIY